MAYQRPMVTVDQNMTITPTSIERDLPAFVFGPNYELHRYTDAEEKPKVAIGTYSNVNTNDMNRAYPGAIDSEQVDKSFTKLYGDNVIVELAILGTPALPEKNINTFSVAVNGGYTLLLFQNKAYVDYDENGMPVVRDDLPQNIAVGDKMVVAYTDGSGSHRILTDVMSVRYSGSPWDLDSSSDPEGVKGTLVEIGDVIPTAGLVESSISVTLVEVEQGVEFERENRYPGHSPLWQWEQPDTEITDDETNISCYGVKINHGALNVPVRGYFEDEVYRKVLFADLYLEYRELLTAYSDTFHSLIGASEVANMLGTISPDNPLAMGVYMAALNSATDDGDEAPPVYFMSVRTDDAEGYAAVLNKATTNDRAYVFAPTTRSDEIIEMVQNHVMEMSAKTVKMWRIASVSADIPREVCRLGDLHNVQGDHYYAIPVSDTGPAVGHGPYNKLRVVVAPDNPSGSSDTEFRSTIVPGDRVEFNYSRENIDAWGVTNPDKYIVKKVINNNTIEITKVVDVDKLLEDESGEYYLPEKIRIFHEYSSKESADVVASTSRHLASRRVLNVFPSVFENNGVKLYGEFAACAVAGLVSATEPQQPITNVTVRGIDNIPLTYQTYNKNELDQIASGGTFIVAQDLPNDRVYVRHQITTAYYEGNLNTAELSITKNVDHISYAFAEVFRPYYGRYNITPNLLEIFNNLATKLIDQFAGVNSVYGPQLIADQTEIQYIRQNELMKDHVDIGIRLGVPYPCNNIDIVLTV